MLESRVFESSRVFADCPEGSNLRVLWENGMRNTSRGSKPVIRIIPAKSFVSKGALKMPDYRKPHLINNTLEYIWVFNCSNMN